MTADLRAALSTLVAALERHLEVATMRRDPDDPSVVAAATDLADAFDDYDELLFETTEVATPLAVFEGDDEDDDADDDEEDDDDEDDDEDDEDDEDEDDEDEDDEDEDDDELDELDEEGASDHYFGLDDEEYDVDDAEDAPVRPASS
jgi:hypothetical protein